MRNYEYLCFLLSNQSNDTEYVYRYLENSRYHKMFYMRILLPKSILCIFPSFTRWHFLYIKNLKTWYNNNICMLYKIKNTISIRVSLCIILVRYCIMSKFPMQFYIFRSLLIHKSCLFPMYFNRKGLNPGVLNFFLWG